MHLAPKLICWLENHWCLIEYLEAVSKVLDLKVLKIIFGLCDLSVPLRTLRFIFNHRVRKEGAEKHGDFIIQN
jgi:hypothetical protein